MAKQYDTANKSIRTKVMHDEWEQKLNCPIIRIDTIQDIETIIQSIKSYL